jgi:phosphatidylserine/phosphatidylglycerophosphate/cardiolipin synthase-like enzyme
MFAVVLAVVLATDGGVDAGVADAGVKLGACREKQTLCFSPTGNCHLVLIDVMDRTTAQLDIAIYSLNHEGIVDAILRAKARLPARDGKDTVRVIVDATQYKSLTEWPQLLRLAAVQIPIRKDGHAGIMHHKFIVADSREFATGSFNFTYPGAAKNNENLLAWDCPRNAVLYQAEFDRLWSGFRDAEVAPADGG